MDDCSLIVECNPISPCRCSDIELQREVKIKCQVSLVLYPHSFPSLYPPSQCPLLFPSAAHTGHLQAAELRLPNIPPVQLWEWVDAAGQDEHRGPAPQRLRHRCLSEPILPRCPGMDVHLFLHPRLGLLHPAPPAQQVCHAQNKVRKTEARDSVVTP